MTGITGMLAPMQFVAILRLVLDNWLWLVDAWVAGIVLWCTIPLLWSGQRAMDHYMRHAMSAMDRVLLVGRDTRSDVAFKALSYDGEHETETFRMDGETRDVRDELDLMGRLYNRTFGILDENFGVVTDLRFGAIGASVEQLEDRGLRRREVELGTETVETDDGEKRKEPIVERANAQYWPLFKEHGLVDPRDVFNIMIHSASPSSFDLGYDWTKKSQSKFWERVSTKQAGFLIAICAVGILGPSLALRIGGDAVQRNGGGGLGRVISGTLWPMFVIALPGWADRLRRWSPW